MAQLSITLSGAPRVERDGILLDITIRKAVALLAYLAVTAAPQTRDTLAALLWPEADQERARGALRYTLAQLKAAIGGEWLYTTRDQIGLRTGPQLVVDVAEVARLQAQVAAHGHPLHQACAVCLPLLQSIVALLHGPLLHGFTVPDSPAFDDWLFFESERLQRVQVDALAALIAVYSAAGDPTAAVPYAQRLVALDPLQEKVNEQLIRLYLESDQPGAALRHYEAFARLLHDEFDAVPDRATTALLARYATAKDESARPHVRLPAAAAGQAPRQAPRQTLPIPGTPLVGRGHELAAIGSILDDPTCRLLTLLGPGGCGKTRLALAAAQARREHAAQHVVFVPLAGLTEPRALTGALAAAVGCPPPSGSDPQQNLLDCLSERPYLLVLDNLEHLLGRADELGDIVVDLLDAILTTVPDIQLLVTSRTRLHLEQEQLYPVQGLDFPEWETQPNAAAFGAVQLFVQRARRVQPDFDLTPATAPGVIQVVRLVAGQPLAIELAAAWVGSMAPDEIAAELRQSIDLLASEARNIPARHRSMRASYRLSWEQLLPAEQAAQQALSVFCGGFTRTAAAQVSGAGPHMLQTLIDRSLLARAGGTGGEGGRYELHELLRQFAAEQLAADPQAAVQVRTRHAAYYLEWAEGKAADFGGGGRQAALRAIEQELGNLQAAWEWAVAQCDLALLSKAIPTVGAYYLQRSRSAEGYAACRRAAARLEGAGLEEAHLEDTHLQSPPAPGAGGLVLAQALAWQANFAVELALFGQARTLLDRSLCILDAPALQPAATQLTETELTGAGPLRAFVHYLLGRLGHLETDVKQARPWLLSSLALYQAQDDTGGTARVLSMLGRLAWLAGDYAEAYDWYARGLACYLALADVFGSILSLSDLAMLSALLERHGQAEQLFEEAAALAQALDDPVEAIKARRAIGMSLSNVGYNAAAVVQFETCLAIAGSCEHDYLRVENLVMLAFIRLMQCSYDQVTVLGREAFALAERARHKRDTGFALMLLGLAELGRGAYKNAHDLLRQCLAVYQVTNVADDQLFSLSGLSHAQRGLGDTQGARHTARQALQIAVQSRSFRAAGLALGAYVNVLLDEQQIERAVELEALLMRHPFGANSCFYQNLNARPVALHAACLPPDVVAAAKARGQARDRLATLDEVWAELAPVAA